AAGVLGGIVSGVLLQLAPMTTADGSRAPAMGLIAGAVHTGHAPLAWLAYLVYTVLLGAAVGWLLHSQQVGEGSGVVWGVLYGGFWWIVSGLVVIPAFYGAGPLTPAAVDVIRNASLPWFAAMLVNGGLMGGAYAVLMHQRPPAEHEAIRTERAA